MNNISEIKARLKVIKQTMQLTRAMYLISAGKIKKALDSYESNQIYFNKVRYAMKDILTHSEKLTHRYLLDEHKPGIKTAYIVIAGNKGMAGGYNNNVCQAAYEHMVRLKDDAEPYIITINQMAYDYFARKGISSSISSRLIANEPKLYHARHIVQMIMKLYDDNVIDELYVVYTHMVSTLKQTVHVERLLPVLLSDFEDVETDRGSNWHIEYEPNMSVVMEQLIPQYLIGQVYGMLLQANASEHCMRMTAMDEANRNAQDIIEKLTLQYNRQRQAQITQQINEITSAIRPVEW